jgi:hypothetical protein
MDLREAKKAASLKPSWAERLPLLLPGEKGNLKGRHRYLPVV